MATRSVAGLVLLLVAVLLVAAPATAPASSDDLSAEEVCELIPAYEGGFGPGEYDPAVLDKCTYSVFPTENQWLRVILHQWSSPAMAADEFNVIAGDLAGRTGRLAEPRDIGEAALHWADGSDYDTLVLVGRFTVLVTGLGGFDTEPVAREVAAIVAALVPATTTTTTAAATTTSGSTTSTTESVSCAPQGTVTDQAGAPMPGLRIRLLLSGQVADQRVTDEDGWYQFADLEFLAEAYEFDLAEDGYVVAVMLQDGVEGAARFEIRYGPQGVLPEVRRGPLTVETDPACRVDFAFADIGDEYSVAAGPGDPDEWRSLALAYQSIRRAYSFATYSLGTPLTMTPLPVYMFCRGNPPGVHGQPCQNSPAYFRGGFSTDEEPEGPPFLAFSIPESRRWSTGERPVNGEYHEFGHALMADAFGGFMPAFPLSVNHAGYRNPTSTDSWTEGFAEWFATQVARHVDGAPRWWLVPIKGQVISLEDARWVTGNQGKDEELAIAGILVDMVDGDADYAAPTSRQLTIVGIADLADPEDPQGDGVAVEIRNDTGIVQSSIGVSGDFGGVAGLFATRVDGFVDPDVLQPGETGQAVIPYRQGFGWDDLETVKVVGLGIGDDDGVTRTAAEVWQAILAYRSTSEHSKGYVMNTTELYEALRDAFPADLAAIDAIFVAQGIFDDTNRNTAHDPGESIGITSLGDGRLRTDYEPPEVFEAEIDTAGVPARVQVQVLYPEPRDALSYAYATVPDPDTGTISVAVPPAHTGALVRMVVWADGHLPALLPDLYAEDFWAQAAAGEYRPFLDYQVTLVAGDVMANALAVGADGSPVRGGGFPVLLAVFLGLAAVAAGGGVWWWRRRPVPALAGGAVPSAVLPAGGDPSWPASHITPASGLPGRPEPHPAVAAVTTLAGGTGVQVVERRADWALVRAVDGTEAWVDARRLTPVAAGPEPLPPPPPDEDAALGPESAASAAAVPARPSVVPLAAAVALLVGAFVPWRAGGWPSPFRVSATFLWDVEAELGGFSIGLVALLLSLAALAALFVPRLQRYRRLVGGVVCGVAALWLIETFRYFWGYGYLGWGFLREVFAAGPWLALAAGLVLVLKRR